MKHFTNFTKLFTLAIIVISLVIPVNTMAESVVESNGDNTEIGVILTNSFKDSATEWGIGNAPMNTQLTDNNMGSFVDLPAQVVLGRYSVTDSTKATVESGLKSEHDVTTEGDESIVVKGFNNKVFTDDAVERALVKTSSTNTGIIEAYINTAGETNPLVDAGVKFTGAAAGGVVGDADPSVSITAASRDSDIVVNNDTTAVDAQAIGVFHINGTTDAAGKAGFDGSITQETIAYKGSWQIGNTSREEDGTDDFSTLTGGESYVAITGAVSGLNNLFNSVANTRDAEGNDNATLSGDYVGGRADSRTNAYEIDGTNTATANIGSRAFFDNQDGGLGVNGTFGQAISIGEAMVYGNTDDPTAGKIGAFSRTFGQAENGDVPVAP